MQILSLSEVALLLQNGMFLPSRYVVSCVMSTAILMSQ